MDDDDDDEEILCNVNSCVVNSLCIEWKSLRLERASVVRCAALQFNKNLLETAVDGTVGVLHSEQSH